jgi:hypothetical protein
VLRSPPPHLGPGRGVGGASRWSWLEEWIGSRSFNKVYPDVGEVTLAEVTEPPQLQL